MLFNKNLEKDNCGYGLICNRNGKPSRKVVEKSIDALSSMAHRGGVGFDGKTGDVILNHNFNLSASYKVQDQFSETVKLENKVIQNLTNKTYEDLLVKMSENIVTK